MVSNLHKDLTAADIHGIGYVQASDPGAVGAGKVWIDTSTGTGNWAVKIRNTDNNAWESISNGAITVESWHAVGGGGEPAFQNSWTNFDATGATAATATFLKDPLGFVHIKGMIKSGTLNQAAWTLPVGYRPAQPEFFVVDSSGAHGRIAVNTDGTVTPNVGNTAAMWLSNIIFKAV